MAVELATPDMKKFGEDLDREWNRQGYALAIELDPQFSDDALKGIGDKLAQAGPFQVALTADLDKFAQDLDQRWRDMAAKHELPIEIAPALNPQALSDQLPGYTRITGDLDLARAESQLAEFFSVIPIYRIPVELDTAVADAQLEELRARAMDPVYMPAAAPSAPANESSPDRALEAMQREDRSEAARQTQINRQTTKQQWETPSAESQAASAAAKKQAEEAAGAAQKLRDEQDKAAQGMRDFQNASKQAADSKPFEMLKDAVGDVGDKLEEVGKTALKWSAIGSLAGGAVADLGAAGLVGMLGAHGIMGAFEAEKGVTEEQRDPEAQLDRQAKIRAASDQVRTANEGLSEATFKVSDSQTAAKLSSMNLADAYKEVGRQVRDATDALTDAQLAEEGAALGVAGARQHLMQDLMSGTADPLAIETDIYGVQAANQKYSESQKKTSDQKVDTQETLQRGVAGSTEIIQATQSNADAQHGVQLALQGVRDAEISVAEAAMDMHRALMPTEAENKLNIAMARLSPNAKDFVNVVHTSVIPAFHDLSQTVSTNMFDGLGESLNKALQDQMPAMKQGFGQIATGLNGMFKDIFSQLDSVFSQLESDGTMQKFVDGVDQTLQGIAPLISGLTKGLIDLGTALGPHLGPLFTELGDFLSKLGTPLGELGGAIADALTKLGPSLSPLLDALGTGLTELIQGLAPSLPTIAQAFTDILTAIDPLIAPLSELGSAILTTIATNVSSLAQALAPVIDQFAQGLQPLIPTITGMLQDLTPIFAQMADEIGQALLDALQQLMPVLPGLVDAFSNLFEQVAPLLPELVDMATSVIPPLVDVMTTVAPILTDVVNAFADMFYWVDQVANRIGDFVSALEQSPLGNTTVNSIPFVGGLMSFLADNHNQNSQDTQDTPQSSGSGFAGGGHVTGPGGPRDDMVDAKLSNGEFVVNADATSQHRGTLEAINAGHYANGGYVSSQQGGGGKDAQKEAIRQSRKRVLGFKDGGYVDDNSYSTDFGDGAGGGYDFTPQQLQGGTAGGAGPDPNYSSFTDHPDLSSSTSTDFGAGSGNNAQGTAPVVNPYTAPYQPVPTRPYAANPAQVSAKSPYQSNPLYGRNTQSAAPGQGFGSDWEADGATGGPVNAVRWARDHQTTPYVWGGAAADGADCSGWVGDLQQVAMGTPDPTARLGTTMDVLSGTWPAFIPGASRNDLFVIGASSEHMVASILGVNMEERQSGETARVGTVAASPWDSQFTTVGHIDPSVFVPAFTDPKSSNSGNSTNGTNGTNGGDSSGGDSSNDALANQNLAVTMPVPETWSGAAGSLINRGLSQFWYGTDPAKIANAAANAKPGSLPVLDDGMHGTLQKTFQGWIDSAPKDQQGALSTFLLGPDLTGNNGKNPGLTGVGANGGLLGVLGVGLLGDGQKIKGLSGLLGEGLSFELQPLEKATGFNDSFKGSPAALWTAGNDMQADAAYATMQQKKGQKKSTPTSGDPSTQHKSGDPSTGHGNSTSANTAKSAAQAVPVHDYDPSGGASQWTDTFSGVLNALGMPQSWLPLGMAQMNTEDASGDPTAVNNSDSNAAAGTPSKGLMQVIDPTFAAEYPKFAGAGFPNNVWDPRSNIAAGLEWAIEEYGSPANVWGQGHGYADGGDVFGEGTSDSDSIKARLSNGEFVVNAASTDRHRSLLHLINQDRSGTMAPVSSVPTRELVSAGAVFAHADQSSTFNVHAHDIDSGMKALKLLEAQRVAKSNSYLGRFRQWRGI